MYLRSQRTLAQPAACCGIGLHSGLIVNLELRPLPPSSGIVFQRVDLPGRPSVAAAVRNVTSTMFATTIESRGVRIGTVEHLLAALADKVEKIKKEQGCDSVLIRVTNDQGRTRIVAKPFRRQAKQSGTAP